MGKESRHNLELNTAGSADFVGDKGWLFKETKALLDLGVIVTLSGDCPFMNKLIGADDFSPNEMGIWVDVKETDLAECLKKHEKTLDALELQRDSNGIPFVPTAELMNDLNDIGCILPKSTDSQGYRTGVSIPFRDTVPKNALICLTDVTHIVPDACHGCSRQAEKDLKLFIELLLEAENRSDHVRKLKANINARNVQNSTFNIHFKDGKTILTATKVVDIKLCGQDARLIYSPAALVEKCDLFEGVLLHGKCVVESTHISAKILKDLHGYESPLVPLQLFENGITGYSERAIGDLMMLSAHNYFQFCRDPNNTTKNIEELVKWVETYFQCNQILFDKTKWNTPYK